MLSGERLLEEITNKENESILGVLFDHYFDSKHEDEPNVEDAYKEFCHSLLDVDPFQIDEIMGAAAFLCMEHERAAFNAGAKACAYLLRELSE